MSATKKLELPLDFVQGIALEEHEPGYLLGTISILGVDHHIELIEVEYRNGGVYKGVPQVEQRPTCHDDASGDGNNNDSRWEALCDLTDSGRFQPVELDGRQWVLYVTPFND